MELHLSHKAPWARPSTDELPFSVPQKRIVRHIPATRHTQRSSLHFIIHATIIILLLQALAHHEAPLLIKCHIATIEKSMNIDSKGKAISNHVLPAFRKRPYMCGIDHRQCTLPRQGAGPTIGIEHLDPKNPLPQARLDEYRCPSVTKRIFCGGRLSKPDRVGTSANLLPYSRPLTFQQSICTPHNGIGFPVSRRQHPPIRWQQPQFRDQTAANLGMCRDLVPGSHPAKTLPHFPERCHTVPVFECFPRQPVRQDRETREIPITTYRIMRFLELEQEGSSNRHGLLRRA